VIVGIGVDTVDIGRFERGLERTPALRSRLFTREERELHLDSLAARFAAKEALIKALGGSGDLRWHDMEVVRDEHRAPSFAATDRLRGALGAVGADRAHLSFAHDGGIATAFVILESVSMSGAGGTLAAAPMTGGPGVAPGGTEQA